MNILANGVRVLFVVLVLSSKAYASGHPLEASVLSDHRIHEKKEAILGRESPCTFEGWKQLTSDKLHELTRLVDDVVQIHMTTSIDHSGLITLSNVILQGYFKVFPIIGEFEASDYRHAVKVLRGYNEAQYPEIIPTLFEDKKKKHLPIWLHMISCIEILLDDLKACVAEKSVDEKAEAAGLTE